jgi:hypothetical protein
MTRPYVALLLGLLALAAAIVAAVVVLSLARSIL